MSGSARRKRLNQVIVWAAVGGFLAWSCFDLGQEIELSILLSAPANIADFAWRMWPPDFRDWRELLDSLLLTIQMAFVGTLLGAIISLPIAALATRRLAPIYVTGFVRVLLNALRTVPSLIWALIFVKAVGLGPISGVMALAIYSAGYLTKFYYEAFESADPSTADALRGMGARGLQVFQHAVWPPARPLVLSQTVFMFEYNVRAAAILGYVGAGGIGFYLYTYFENFRYARALACLLILLVVVIILDAFSGWVRKRLTQ